MNSYRLATGFVLMLVSGLMGARALGPLGDPEHARLLAAGVALAAGVYLLATARRAAARRSAPAVFQALPPPPPRRQDAPCLDGPFLLGEILLTRLPRLRRLQVEAALHAQRGTGKRLGQIMTEMGLITATELDDALRLQRRLREGCIDSYARQTSGGPYAGPRANMHQFDFGAAEQ